MPFGIVAQNLFYSELIKFGFEMVHTLLNKPMQELIA